MKDPKVVEKFISHLWNTLFCILYSRAKSIGRGKIHQAPMELVVLIPRSLKPNPQVVEKSTDTYGTRCVFEAKSIGCGKIHKSDVDLTDLHTLDLTLTPSNYDCTSKHLFTQTMHKPKCVIHNKDNAWWNHSNNAKRNKNGPTKAWMHTHFICSLVVNEVYRLLRNVIHVIIKINSIFLCLEVLSKLTCYVHPCRNLYRNGTTN